MDQKLKREGKRMQLDYNNLKSGGFIKQTQENLFTVRLRCPGGRITSAQLRKAADIAEKYGKGEVHTSMRQSIEVPHVHYQHFDAISNELRDIGWSVASCGPRIRVPTACAGCSWNPNGIMDTQKACLEVDRRYFGTESGHHKFKITFSGCPIDCPRSRETDLGFQGIVEPEVDEDSCNSCKLCAVSCEEKALTMVNDFPVRDAGKCNYCGDCIKICPIDAMKTKRKGWLIRVGGKHGKHPYYAYEVAQFATDDQCYALIEKTMPWYKANANGRERIAVAIERAGLGKYLEEVVKPLGLEIIEKPEDRKKYWTAGNLYR
ncbi:MAG: 4Fe-4S binding protein [Dehalococcoidales bacterium]|nr:4Fe-4S binding protein [Dehalococcoidales bacterium]